MSELDTFRSTVQQVFRAKAQIDRRHPKRGTPSTTRAFAVQGLYLVTIRAFEAYIENQIFGYASGTSTWSPRVIDGETVTCTPRLKEDRPDILFEIVSRGKSYNSFLPYKNTSDLAKFLFIDGKPFVSVKSTDKEILARCSKVRNFIAHNSGHAKKEFLEEATKIAGFKKTPRRVIDYMDLGFRAGVTYFEHDLSTLARVATFLD